MKCIFLVWYGYQRRAEVLGPRLAAEVFYLPNLFRSKMLRPLDYVLKLVRSIRLVQRSGAQVVFVQSPPLYGALAALFLRLPFVIDAHHGVLQGFWSRIPFSAPIWRRAQAVIVHHRIIQDFARKRLPRSHLVVISDPIVPIKWPVQREQGRVLFICSFDPNEPVEIIAEVIEAMPEFSFYITANIGKLTPAIRAQLISLPNLTLTGFLSTERYQRLLCSSAVVVDLDESEYAQPSGACEALSSDTPLVVSSTALTRDRFGDWAFPVEHRTATIVAAIRKAASLHLDLSSYRERWNTEVDANITALREYIEAGSAHQLAKCAADCGHLR
jgi:glycosyltransferase involved in cell wall biosynthesis